ncbi:hypothetical protein FXO37_29637 [Capsicum annuum]|nr:hypothetical protein FXO37_29637 [Capsicum annuum]
MMRRFTNQRNLVKPRKTRFVAAFLTLQRMFKQKSNLRTMFISKEWNKSKFVKEVLGEEVARIMLSFHFWNNIAYALKSHTKKRNKLTLKRLSELVFIKYNRTLRHRYNVHNGFDPISLDKIDVANEWLIGIENAEDESISYGDTEYTWGVVIEESRVDERHYGLKASTSSLYDKEKKVATSTRDEKDEEFEDDEYYVNTQRIEHLHNINELEEL